MSEFTDFYALLTEADTLNDLRGALERTVKGAYLPLDELPREALEDPAKTEAAWANHPKPAWLKLGLAEGSSIEDLAKIGTAVRIRVEEDFIAWALDIYCGEYNASFAILDSDGQCREATDMVPLYDASQDFSGLADCLGIETSALQATFVVDGGQAFSKLVGIQYEQMLDMELEDVAAGSYTLGNIND